MRWLLIALFVFLTRPAFAQVNEAEKIFRAMETKICEAKTLKVIVEIDADFGPADKGKMRGTLHLSANNQAKYEFEAKVKDRTFKVLVVSDGKQFVEYKPNSPRPQPKPTAAHLGEAARALLARGGIAPVGGVIYGNAKKGDFDADKELLVSEFVLGKEGVVRGKKSLIIEFVATGAGKEKANIKLWIDALTMLPLKRIVVPVGQKNSSSTEIYTEFTVDADLVAAMFELPKKPPAQWENDAERLFRDVEKKIVEAKSLKFSGAVSGVVSDAPKRTNLKAAVQMAEGNKLRYEFKGEIDGQPADSMLLSDGKQMLSHQKQLGDAVPEPTDPGLNQRIAAALARGGIMLWRITKNPVPNPFDIERLLPVSDFTLGAKQRLGQTETQVIEHVVILGDERDIAIVKVWIDTATMLPLKRQVQIRNLKGASFTETYAQFDTEAKIDGKVFELAK